MMKKHIKEFLSIKTWTHKKVDKLLMNSTGIRIKGEKNNYKKKNRVNAGTSSLGFMELGTNGIMRIFLS